MIRVVHFVYSYRGSDLIHEAIRSEGRDADRFRAHLIAEGATIHSESCSDS